MVQIERLNLLVTMLKEVAAGTWKCAPVEILEDCDENGNRTMVPGELMPKLPTYFDLSDWISHENNPYECGFAACAMGHAMLDQRFIDQGFHTDGDWPLLTMKDQNGVWEAREWQAIELFFGIPEYEAEKLFCRSGYRTQPGRAITPLQVAEKVEAYIATLGSN